MMIRSKRLPEKSAEYQSVPDDPAEWASMMQQWTKMKDIPRNRNPDLPKSTQTLIQVKSEVVDPTTTPQILKQVKSEVVDSPTSPQSLNQVKSEVVDSPASPQILKPIKTEIVDLPASLQILKPVKATVNDFPMYRQNLKPLMSEEIEASLLSGTDFAEAPMNVVADVHLSNSSKDLPTKVRKTSKKKKKKNSKKKEKMKPRLTILKPDVVLSNDVQRQSISQTPKQSRFSTASVQPSQLDLPSNGYSVKNNLNDDSQNEIKDKIMEESMQKVKLLLTQLLMETTESQVMVIAREELKREKSIAQSVRKKFSVLSSLSGKLGLKIYDCDDSDASERQRNEKNQMESDEELQTIIDQRRRNFEKIEMQIDLEIESCREKARSIAYQNNMKKDSNENGIHVNKLLKSTDPGTNNINTNTASKAVPKSHNSTVDSCNKSKKPPLQTYCRQKNGTKSTIKRNGVIQNQPRIEPMTPANSSSSTSTLSPSSLSSTTSWSSESEKSPRFSRCYSSRSDSSSDRDSFIRHKSRPKIRSSSSKTRRYPRHSRSRSRESRRTVSPRNRHSSNWRNKSNCRHSTPYCKNDSPSRFKNRMSRSRSERKSPKYKYSNRYRHSSVSSESARSSYKRLRR